VPVLKKTAVRFLALWLGFGVHSGAVTAQTAPPRAAAEIHVRGRSSCCAPRVEVGGHRLLAAWLYFPPSAAHFSGPPAIKGKVVPRGWDWPIADLGRMQQSHADYFLQTTME